MKISSEKRHNQECASVPSLASAVLHAQRKGQHFSPEGTSELTWLVMPLRNKSYGNCGSTSPHGDFQKWEGRGGGDLREVCARAALDI